MRQGNEQDFRHHGRLAHPVVPRELVADVELAVGRVLVGAVDLGAQRIGPSMVFRLPDIPYGQLKEALEDFYGVWVGVNPSRMRVLHNPDDELRVLPADLRDLVGETAVVLVKYAISVGEEVLGPETKAEVTDEMRDRLYWGAVGLYTAWVHQNPDAEPVLLHNPVADLKRRLTNFC